ncbi:MAG: hypothetical protein JW793_05960 [Acidobacteria bacterium]|nr:hypothetical protein [Acidobacteriota bacterium]
MKKNISALGAIALLALCASVFAAGVDGKWESERPGRDGQPMITTFEFQSKGSELTGKIITARGETPISEGKIDGNNISFAVVRSFGGNEMKQIYKGKVAGDEITFTMEFEGGLPGGGMGAPPGGGAGAPGGGMGAPPGGGGRGGPGEIIAKRVK